MDRSGFEVKMNKIYFGDCLEVMKGFEDNSVDCVITDPPYGYLDHKLDKSFDYKQLFDECKRVMKKDSFLVFFGRGTEFYKWNTHCNEIGLQFKEELIWDKVHNSSPTTKLMRVHETVAVYQKGKKLLNKVHINKIEYDLSSNEGRRVIEDLRIITQELNKIHTFEDFEKWENEYKPRKSKHNITQKIKFGKSRGYCSYQSHTIGKVLSSIMRVNREHYQFEHPTQKPVELLKLLVQLCSNENDIILDPFMGSGTTCVAAKELNRQYIGIEIDNEYYNIAKNRIDNTECQLNLFDKECISYE